MNCETVLESITQGRPVDDPAVAAHLAVCPECRLRVGPAEALGRHLRDPLIWEDPPDRLAEQVVMAVEGESAIQPGRPRWWIMGAVAALVVIVLLGVRFADRPDWTLELMPSPDVPRATATVDGWNMEHGTRMVVQVEGLEPTGSNAFYELWLTAPDGRHVSAGTFRDSGRFEMIAGVRRSEFPRLWITWEPADDDPAPYSVTLLDTPEA